MKCPICGRGLSAKYREPEATHLVRRPLAKKQPTLLASGAIAYLVVPQPVCRWTA